MKTKVRWQVEDRATERLIATICVVLAATSFIGALIWASQHRLPEMIFGGVVTVVFLAIALDLRR